MENKYFTPDIEDIRVGYECECYLPKFGAYGKKESDEWQHLILNDYDAFGIRRTLEDGFIRVPYLTKEQIEVEGWKPYELKGFPYRYGSVSYRHGFIKDNYALVLDTRKYHIEIIAMDVLLIEFLPEFPENFRVTIPCKDINTFRYICKLLNIK